MSQTSETQIQPSQEYDINCNTLNQIQQQLGLSVGLSIDEVQNPSHTMRVIQTLERASNLKIATPDSGRLFYNTDPDFIDFDIRTLEKYGKQPISYALRTIVYLGFARRLAIDYTHAVSLNDYAFDIRDFMQTENGFYPEMFDSISDIPNGILDRLNYPIESMEKLVKNSINQIDNTLYDIEQNHNTVQDLEKQKAEHDNTTDISKEIQKIMAHIQKQYQKIDKTLSYVHDQMIVFASRKPAKTPIYQISKFILNMTPAIALLDGNKAYDDFQFMTLNDGGQAVQSDDKDHIVMRYLGDIDEHVSLYDKQTHTWQRTTNMILNHIGRISTTLQTKDKLSVDAEFKQMFTNQSVMRVGFRKPNVLFVLNGMIQFKQMIPQQRLDYTFIPFESNHSRQMMFEYPTRNRIPIQYREDLDSYTVFKNPNDTQEQFTANDFFSEMGKKGYDIQKINDTHELSQQELDDMYEEGNQRTNLLKEVLLSNLIAYGSLPIMRERFFWLLGRSNSGKTTYAQLNKNMVGEDTNAISYAMSKLNPNDKSH